MSLENPIKNNFDDLYNEDTRNRILESGSDEEIERLKIFFNSIKAPIDFDVLKDYVKLRQKTHQTMQKELEIRKQTNPKATIEELDMGAYIENIEPQVREAVINLRQKGYNTQLSGFDDENQLICFEEEYPMLNEKYFANIKINDIYLKVEKDRILFTCKKIFTIEELKNIWNKIVEAVPNLKVKAKQCSLSQAELFRKKQKELNN